MEALTQANHANTQALLGAIAAQQNPDSDSAGNREVLQQLQQNINYVDRGTQYLLAAHYREHAAQGTLPAFPDVEFRNHSQTGDDGILCYLFALIGSNQKRSMEICAGNGKQCNSATVQQCNSANLIINYGWYSLLFEGNDKLAAIGDAYFRRHADTWINPPRFVHTWITAENVNELIQANGVSGEVDLLSIDIDGIDYWLWDAIKVISPRVVVVEVNTIWGADAAVTVPYQPDFQTEKVYDGDTLVALYCGASLPAFVNARQ